MCTPRTYVEVLVCEQCECTLSFQKNLLGQQRTTMMYLSNHLPSNPIETDPTDNFLYANVQANISWKLIFNSSLTFSFCEAHYSKNTWNYHVCIHNGWYVFVYWIGLVYASKHIHSLAHTHSHNDIHHTCMASHAMLSGACYGMTWSHCSANQCSVHASFSIHTHANPKNVHTASEWDTRNETIECAFVVQSQQRIVSVCNDIWWLLNQGHN